MKGLGGSFLSSRSSFLYFSLSPPRGRAGIGQEIKYLLSFAFKAWMPGQARSFFLFSSQRSIPLLNGDPHLPLRSFRRQRRAASPPPPLPLNDLRPMRCEYIRSTLYCRASPPRSKKAAHLGCRAFPPPFMQDFPSRRNVVPPPPAGCRATSLLFFVPSPPFSHLKR